MKPKAKPCPRQDSRQAKDTRAACPERRYGRLSIPAWRLHRLAPWRGQGQHPSGKRERPLAQLAAAYSRRGVEAP